MVSSPSRRCRASICSRMGTDTMKEMIYQKERILEVLDSGTYRGIPYWIISLGTHPSCYLDVTDHLVKTGISDPWDLDIECHGDDLSYVEDRLYGVWDQDTEGFEPNKRTFIGWHYRTQNDYLGDFPDVTLDRYKWTFKELLHDLKLSIDSLFPYESKYGLKQMRYVGKLPKSILLGSGTIKGVPWWIVSYGSHPCVYFDVTGLTKEQADQIAYSSHEWVSFDQDNFKPVWDESTPGFKPKARRFIGWDYAHIGLDYIDHRNAISGLGERIAMANGWPIFNLVKEGHRWTSDELYEEVNAAIENAMKEQAT